MPQQPISSWANRPFHAGKRPLHLVIYSLVLALFLSAGLLANLATAIPAHAAASSKKPLLPPPAVSQMTAAQFLQEGQRNKAYHGSLIRPSKPLTVPLSPKDKRTDYSHLPPSSEPVTMQPLSQSLSTAFTTIGATGKPLDVHGSDGRLEVQLQAGSLDLSQAMVNGGGRPTGSLTLQVQQLHGHFIGLLNQLGAYQMQVVDSQGHLVTGIILRTPITLIYHYQLWEMQDLNLDANHILLTWPTLIETAQTAKQSRKAFVLPMLNDPQTHTLTAQSSVIGAGPFDLVSTPQYLPPPTPHLASVGGNNGQLTYSYPLQIPPGPDGFAPPLSLNYSSLGPNERYSQNSPAGSVGDGWSLPLGSISSEFYGSGAASPGQWYFISGVDGVGDRLVQDTTITSGTFYQTEHISHLRIQQIPGSQTSTGQPCFNVWDKDGAYYQFGCTSDSLQYYYSSGSRQNYRWDVNKIVAPNDNNGSFKLVLVSYLQDQTGSGTSAVIRDAAIKQITYGTGTSTNTITTLAGTIDFQYHMPSVPSGQGQWATAYGSNANYNCSKTPPQNTSLRCDDPLTYNSMPAPTVMSTMELDSVTSYVGSDTSSSHTAYQYTLKYQDSPFIQDSSSTPCKDNYSQNGMDCAGEHLLTQITPFVYQNGSAHQLPPATFSYTQLQDTYYDSQDNNLKGSPYSAQTNWSYLSSFSDLNTGEGETVSYATAYSNTHGTPYVTNGSGTIIDDRHDPLFCWIHRSDSYQCTGNFAHPDDHAWSEQAVTQIVAAGKDSSSSKLNDATTTYNYQLAVTGSYSGNSTDCYPAGTSPYLPGQTDCVGDNWLPVNEGNPQQPIDDSDWQDYFHSEYHGFVGVLITSPANNLTVDTYYSTEGWDTPNSNSGNYNSGALQEEEVYQGNQAQDAALLQKTFNQYTGNNGYFNSCNGNLNTTYAPCAVMVVYSTTTTYEGTGSGNSNAPWVTHTYTYDDYSQSSGLLTSSTYHNETQEVITSSNAPTLTKKWTYTPNDSGYNATGYIYYTVDKVTHSEIDDSSGKVWQCQDTSYDQGAPSGVSTPAAGWPTTSKSYSDCTNQSSTAITAYTGYDAYGNVVATVDGVATANSSLYSSNGCTLSSAPSIFASAWGQSHYTGCTTYDSYLAQPTTVSNALGQSSSLSYDYTQGALPTSTTDPNSQTTSIIYSYDSNSASNGKSIVQVKEPGENGSYTSQSYSSSSCSTSSSLPCFEIENNSSAYSNDLAQTFYDALGRKVETRTSGPVSGDDTVVFTLYNDGNNSVLTSVPFEVPDGSGYIDPATAVYAGTSQAPGGTVTFSDALGRTLAVQDPNFGTSQEPGHACSTALTGNYSACSNYTLDVSHVSGDSNTYETVTSVDPNDHISISSIDELGRTRYIQIDSGVHSNPSTMMGNERETYQYNVLNEATSVTDTDLVPQSNETITSITTTASYDSLGRMTQLVDPERGTHSYTYDADGHMIADVSGSRTLGYSYDLLGRVGCIQDQSPTQSATGACSSGANPFVQNTYDTNILGTQGSNDFPIGRLTQSKAINYFPGPDYTQGNVTEQMQYDNRGRLTNETLQISASGGSLTFPSFPTYQLSQSYNDDDQPTTTTTSSNPSGLGYSFTNFYDSTTGALTGLGTTTSAANLATLSYNANALPGMFTFQSSTNTALAQEQFSYDNNLRITNATATWQSGSGTSGTIYSQALGYDAASNITSSTTTQAVVSGASNSGGSETEIYCYDEQNRLVWAGNSGTPQGASNGTCGSGTPSNSLSNATYSNQYVYTHLGQLWQGPYNGSGSYQYLYCNSSQPHQLTGLYPTGTTCSTTSGKTQSYAASYDSWGNMTTRTASGTGGTTATLSYDGQDHLMRWNDTNTTTNEEWYMYDASGQRVLRRSQTGTGNSNTKYTITPFGLEDHIYDGGGTNLNNKYYYYLGGQLIGVNTGSINYLFSDALGSVVASITNTANSASVKGNQVYGPYGNNPYSKGTMGTTKGYTGQYNDSLTQLDYYGARYYDPLVGAFLSADKVQGNPAGMDPYSYTGENPETNTDPNGEMYAPPGGPGQGNSTSVLYDCGSPFCDGGGDVSFFPEGEGGGYDGSTDTHTTDPARTTDPTNPNDPATTGDLSVTPEQGAQIDASIQAAEQDMTDLKEYDWQNEIEQETEQAQKQSKEGDPPSAQGDGLDSTGPTDWGNHNPGTQFKEMCNACNIRDSQNFNSNRAYSKNLAYIADEGGTPLFFAVSGEISGDSPLYDWTVHIPEGEEPSFAANPGRELDSEVKLLENLARIYDGGTYRLFTEREPCASCEGVINQFLEEFGEQSLQVEWYLPRWFEYL